MRVSSRPISLRASTACCGAASTPVSWWRSGRDRGWTDLVINGSFWIGAALGAVSAIWLLDPELAGPDVGWRLAYLIGACLGLIVLVMRIWIPESPRWLMIHGQPERAEAIAADIERSGRGDVSQAAFPKIKLRMRS